MIRVLVAEDSNFMAEVITSILTRDPEIRVIGVARDGKESIRMASELKPDLITMDVQMPRMSGLDATKQIMAYSPVPILILTTSVNQGGVDVGLKAMALGAADVLEKDFDIENDAPDSTAAQLVEKVKYLSKIKVLPHLLAKIEGKPSVTAVQQAVPNLVSHGRAVGIVASTGGPVALLTVLKMLPSPFPAPILIVQHIASGFVKGLASWIGDSIPFKTKLGQQGETIEDGTVYLSPSETHMEVGHDKKIVLRSGPPVDGACPSGTVLLDSIGRVYGDKGLGVILTGMGRDGADGMRTIHHANGRTIAQDESSSVIYGMPKEAVEMKVAQHVLPLHDIAGSISAWMEQ